MFEQLVTHGVRQSSDANEFFLNDFGGAERFIDEVVVPLYILRREMRYKLGRVALARAMKEKLVLFTAGKGTCARLARGALVPVLLTADTARIV